MTSIPAAICRVYRKHFKRHYIKQKNFFSFFLAFWKYARNLEHFQKEVEYNSLMISDLIDAEKRGYLNV